MEELYGTQYQSGSFSLMWGVVFTACVVFFLFLFFSFLQTLLVYCCKFICKNAVEVQLKQLIITARLISAVCGWNVGKNISAIFRPLQSSQEISDEGVLCWQYFSDLGPNLIEYLHWCLCQCRQYRWHCMVPFSRAWIINAVGFKADIKSQIHRFNWTISPWFWLCFAVWGSFTTLYTRLQS